MNLVRQIVTCSLMTICLVVVGCSAPVTSVFDASDVSNSAPVANCPDFSGLWLAENGERCMARENNLYDTTELQFPGNGGYRTPTLPALIEIRQGGCAWLLFRVVDEAPSPTPYSFIGAETRVSLRPGKKNDVSWSEDRLAVRRREPLKGPIILPGFARSWSAWSLKLEDPDTLDYSYVFMEKGAMLFLLPFKDLTGSSCTLRRLQDPDADWS